MAAQTSTDTGPAEAEVAKAEEAAPQEQPAEAEVAKADGAEGKAAQVAVYDSRGNLVGVADPADITPLANVAAPSKGDDMDEAAAAPPADAMPDAAPADPADMTPAPAADAGTPADAVPDDDVAKATAGTEGTDEHAVLKSIIAEVVAAALDARAPAEDIAKSADVAAALGEVETLKARLAVVEEQPGMPKVFTNGAVPPASQLRGQDTGAVPVDVAKALERKKAFTAATAAEQNQMAGEMQQQAIDALAAVHAARR